MPAANTAIRHMIKETDGDHFEEMRSLEQNLTFEKAEKEFADRNVKFGQTQMKTLGIMTQDGVYTNLGLLLSDQCVHTIKAAVFEGTNQSQFQDRKEFTGSLFQQMDDVYDFIDFRNQTHSSFEKLRRIDRRDYPEAAVREALLNLLVHREYSFRASTFISIYTDRIEFTSIGGLVSGVTLKDVTMGMAVKGLVCELPPVDSGYRMEIHAILSNVCSQTRHIPKGARIGQLVITPVLIADFVTKLGEHRVPEPLAAPGNDREKRRPLYQQAPPMSLILV